MSTSFYMGIVKKVPLEEENVKNFVKVFFNLCNDIEFTKVFSNFTHNNLNDINPDFEFEFKKPPTMNELSNLIKKFASINGVTSFPFTADSKSGGFDADFSIKNTGEVIIIEIFFDDYIPERHGNLEKLLEICESIYNSVGAFYAYILTEYDPFILHLDEFKKVFKKYKKTGKSSFDMKKFREKVKERFSY
ncbi:hypothetical protein J4206_06050 [Candidatus Woesearchaeota archaeon]|nr:hypothetical protein [Candidatus Woesearchaeota archaeon]